MNKFKKGDEVIVVRGGQGVPYGNIHDVVTIVKTGAYCDEVGYEVYPRIGNSLSMDYHGMCGESSFELYKAKPTYPNPPHKHAELIKAWADGAEIQILNTNKWYDCNSSITLNSGKSPTFLNVNTYRIKPTKSDKDIKLEQLEIKAQELADEIKDLRNASD